ncbi:hypothetical protein GCM10009841_33210 [Microlunatus panaciterrae]|uniref:Antibiotic biosynthesis monooxygenase n=1 Tax=Microlunatus panaciterrae TaxID=400768 RepID=A0ABS2RG55_9ACTN|nr:hypothetical protein [Microlunatus panaciterrae]MBM7797979.1 hypothetical protein [Microlunatus panaciterrae]
MYAFTQDVPIDETLYARIIENLGPEPLAGLLSHLCVRRPDGGLRYIDVWTDVESCQRAFEERIHPAVDAAFGDRRPATEPTVHPLEVLHASGLWQATNEVPIAATSQR